MTAMSVRLVNISSFFFMLSLSLSVNPVLPLAVLNLGGNEVSAGIASSMYNWVGLFVRIPSGILADMKFRRTMILFGTVVSIASALLFMNCTSVVQIYVVAAVFGLTTMYMPPSISSVMSSVEPGKLPFAIASYTMWNAGGRVVGPVLGGFLLAHFGMAAVYSCAAAAGLISLVLVMMTEIKESNEPARFLMKQAVAPDIGVSSVARAVQMIAPGVIVAYMPVYLSKVHNFQPDKIGILMGSITVASLLTRPLAAVLSSKYSRALSMLIATCGMCALISVVGYFADFYLLLLMLVLIGTGDAVNQITTVSLVGSVSGSKRFGVGSGVVGLMHDLGLAIGKFVPGMIIGALGYPFAFGIMSAFAALSAAGLYPVVNSLERKTVVVTLSSASPSS